MRTIQDLRKLAELNLCDECFLKYKALIEPNIREWLIKPLSDWRTVESHITQMVMKINGVFKGDSNFIALDEGDDEKFADEVDAEAFRRIKKWSFKRKIDFLNKKGILQDASHRLLDGVRKVRNTIHEEYFELSERDLTLFYVASAIASQIYMVTMFPMARISQNYISNAEKTAEYWLLKINK